MAWLGFSLFRGNGKPREQAENDLATERERMVEEQIRRRGVLDEKVLAAMRKVGRHRFVDKAQWGSAYGDYPLPIGEEQTISQPYIVALMTEALHLKGDDKVLEVGTGSGYQTAVLAEIVREVYSVEVRPKLSERAQAVLNELGYTNVRLRVGDGRQGWPEEAPFDAIMVTAAPREVPGPLLYQLEDGGRLVIPVGSLNQELELHTRAGGSYSVQRLASVRFVPLR